MTPNRSSVQLTLPPYLPMLMFSMLVAIISACIMSPIYTQIISNIATMYTFLPIVVDYAIIIFDTVYIALIYAIVSYSTYSYLKGCESKYYSLLLVGSVIIVKHILNLTVSSIIDGYIDITFDIPVTLFLILADIITVLIVRAIAINKSGKHLNRAHKIQKAAKYLENVVYDEKSEVYPFRSLTDINNPILFPIFVGIVISVAVFWAQRLFADFVVIGLPSSIYEVVDIVISYALDVLLGVIGYIVAYYAASYTFIKNSN